MRCVTTRCRSKHQQRRVKWREADTMDAWTLLVALLATAVLLPTVLIALAVARAYLVKMYVQLPPTETALVLVLGDIARSPRIQHQAAQLARLPSVTTVFVAGYVDVPESISYSQGSGDIPTQAARSALLPQYRSNRKLSVIPLPHGERAPREGSRLRYVWFVVRRVVVQTAGIVAAVVFRVPHCSVILVQTPTAVPTLLVAQFLAWLVYPCAKVVVDWHNLAYTLMGEGAPRPVVKLAKWIEFLSGKYAFVHVTVSREMAKFLREDVGVKNVRRFYKVRNRVGPNTNKGEDIVEDDNVVVLYDHAPQEFHRLQAEERKFFLESPDMSLDSWINVCRQAVNYDPIHDEEEFKSSEHSSTKSGKFRLVVSSTSWTEDEDFGILLRALERYEECMVFIEKKYKSKNSSNVRGSGAVDNQQVKARLLDVLRDDEFVLEQNKFLQRDTLARGLHRLAVVITGKGPQRAMYEETIRVKNFKYVKIITKWLKFEDYPRLLGSCDLGVSLHTSSSGMDLPMKIVDMFGCSLPVAAVRYQCLEQEMVYNGVTGFTFKSVDQLVAILVECFTVKPQGEVITGGEGGHREEAEEEEELDDNGVPDMLDEIRRNIFEYNKKGDWDTAWPEAMAPLARALSKA